MICRKSLLFIGLLIGPWAMASRVVSVHNSKTAVAVTHLFDRSWAENERLCVYQEAKEVACGTVTATSDKGAVLTFGSPVEGVLPGDSVRVASLDSISEGAVYRGMVGKSLKGRVALPDSGPADLSLGVLWLVQNEDQHHPFVELQYLLTKNLTAGVTLSFFNPFQARGGYDSTTSWGGGIHYYSKGPYRGFWISAQGARFKSTGTGVPDLENTHARLNLGWRWKGNDTNGGIGVGAGPEITLGDDSNVAMMFRIQIGVGFDFSQIFY